MHSAWACGHGCPVSVAPEDVSMYDTGKYKGLDFENEVLQKEVQRAAKERIKKGKGRESEYENGCDLPKFREHGVQGLSNKYEKALSILL